MNAIDTEWDRGCRPGSLQEDGNREGYYGWERWVEVMHRLTSGMNADNVVVGRTTRYGQADLP